MCMLKRFSLMVATALGICLVAPTGDAKDAGIASTLPSLGINLDRSDATGLTSPTLDGRDSPIFASSQCCNQDDSSCCPLGASSEETEIAQSTGQQCFDLAELSAVGVSAAIGNDWMQATSHCCNTNVKTCCSQVAPSTIQEAPLSPEPKSFDLAELNMVGDASAFGDNPLQASSHCCTETERSCCAPKYPEDEVEDSLSLQPKNFELAELNTVGVASSFGDDWLQGFWHCCDEDDDSCCPYASSRNETVGLASAQRIAFWLASLETSGHSILDAMGSSKLSHCCNKENKTCCPLMPIPQEAMSEDSFGWLQGSYGATMEDLSSWSMALVSPGANVAWLDPRYCCNASTGNFTCCAPVKQDRGADGPQAWDMTGESSGQFVAMPPGVFQLWFDQNQRARAVCLN